MFAIRLTGEQHNQRPKAQLVESMLFGILNTFAQILCPQNVRRDIALQRIGYIRGDGKEDFHHLGETAKQQQ